MNNCLFCKIAEKEISSKVVYENERVLAFLDINPLASGHTLIIPKNHAENILELSDEDLVSIFRAGREVVLLLNKALKPNGFTIGVNHGKVSGQSIDHFHLHLIPRFQGDGGGSLHSVVNAPPKESLDETYARLNL